MKEKWRKILNEWKANGRGSKFSSVPKDEFPGLLKELMSQLQEKAIDNLKSGFRKTGIFPIDRQQVLNRLCNTIITNASETVRENVGNTFIEHLKKVRQEATTVRQIRRKKRLNVPPGKSISSTDFMNNENAEAQLITPSIDEDNIPDGTQPSTSGHKTNSDTDEISEDEIMIMISL
ncbi:hypothetical protein QE152_g27462 [Popillia japonica]|uniref:Uncharacterized protein n=1 Tax=Popillia japonica TaxID=7064 RepID=A0AAW1JS45_POPJA